MCRKHQYLLITEQAVVHPVIKLPTSPAFSTLYPLAEEICIDLRLYAHKGSGISVHFIPRPPPLTKSGHYN